MRAPRKQAHRLTEWLTRDQPALRGVLLGARREGKSDLLAQTHQLLFDCAEGPLPFWFRFEPANVGDAAGDAAAQIRQAMRFAAAFCQQIRAFLLRQDELLSEAPGELATELERPGVPLALSELGREILAASKDMSSGGDLLSLISRLPARFAHREGRPVCHLWDDCHLLLPDSPYFTALDAAAGVGKRPSRVCFLLTGFAPQMRLLLGQRKFAAVPLQSFAISEALLMAESSCKAAGIRFNREVWESWFTLAGTSPGWAAPLIESAGLQGEPLESLEQLGRLYATELESGSLGVWLAERWPLPAPTQPAGELAPRAIATLLASGAAASLTIETAPVRSTVNQKPGAAAALDHEEWLRLRPFAAENLISPVEGDWLRLESDRAAMGGARAKARLLQDFLLRARRLAETSHDDDGALSFDAIEEHLLYPPSPGAAITTPTGDELRLPEISSVVREATPEGELFWSFGATLASKAGRKSAATSSPQRLPVVLLIAHADSAPSKSVVAEWARRLQQEAVRPNEPAGALKTELWVVLPKGASLAPAGNEKRLSRETFAALLTSVEQPAELSDAPPPIPESVAGAGSGVEEIGRRLAELQTRAQWLQQEFRSSQRSTTGASGLKPEPVAAPASSAEGRIDRRNEYLRQALSLSLMLASADLVATGSGGGAAEGQKSLADLQLQCQQLLDQLHAQSGKEDSPGVSEGKLKPFPPNRS